VREQLTDAMIRKLKLIHPLLYSLNSITENIKCVYSTAQVTLGLIRTPQAVVAATTGERRRGERGEEMRGEEMRGMEWRGKKRRGENRREKKVEQRRVEERKRETKRDET
jgi:hypothetical protein